MKLRINRDNNHILGSSSYLILGQKSEPEKMARSLMSLYSLSSIVLLLAIFISLVENSNQMRVITTLAATNNVTKIEKTCAESLEPEVCTNCVKNDPSRQFDDLPGFTHSLLNCMLNETTKAHDTANSLASQPGISPSLKKDLTTCINELQETVHQTQLALISLELSHYQEAWDSAMAARRRIFRCSFEFNGNADFTIPSELLGPLVLAKQQCDATYGLFVLLVG